MSPSRGDGSGAEAGEMAPGEAPSPQAVRDARAALRSLLADLHVLDALPERSRMLAVDAELPVHAVLATVLSEQHPQPHAQRSSNQPYAGLAGAAGMGQNSGAGSEAGASGGAGQMRREGGGAAAAEEQPPTLSCGVVLPSLPSNVLAEVCEFDPCGPVGDPAKAADDEGADDKQAAIRRQWTSPDDGWGSHMSMPQDLEKMPMGMPVTVGELADFLAYACANAPAGEGGTAPAAPQRWAEPVNGSTEDKEGAAAPPAADMLDWSLTQWRAYRHKARSAAEDAKPPPGDAVEPTSRLFVEERPRGGGPVLVHRVPSAPPRPILCTDDPDASLLKAVELLLAYPELDALPIVSPVRCTVVAHLTLSYCLAYTLGRMRGAELMPVANLPVSAQCAGAEGGGCSQRKFDSSKVPADSGGGDTWAERASPEATQSPWVISRSQPLRELLAFFARTHHSGVPVVEDEGGGGGVLGLLSRRDLLHFLDLSMQSAGRHGPGGADDGAERVTFDAAAPVEAVLEALKKFRGAFMDEESSTGLGASLIYEKELTLKALALKVLVAENRKLLFVQGQQDGDSGKAPRLTRILSVTDVWGLLIGSEQERLEAGGERPSEALTTEEL